MKKLRNPYFRRNPYCPKKFKYFRRNSNISEEILIFPKKFQYFQRTSNISKENHSVDLGRGRGGSMRRTQEIARIRLGSTLTPPIVFLRPWHVDSPGLGKRGTARQQQQRQQRQQQAGVGHGVRYLHRTQGLR